MKVHRFTLQGNGYYNAILTRNFARHPITDGVKEFWLGHKLFGIRCACDTDNGTLCERPVERRAPARDVACTNR